jgi:hypothetical protein
MSNDFSMPVDASASSSDPGSIDRALRQIIVPPSLPPGFRSKLMAIASNDGLQLETRRFDLAVEHQREIQRLQSGYVQLRRHSLAVVIASTFAAGVCASLLLPWLYRQAGSDLSLTMPLVAAVIGAAAGASIWIERFGRAARQSAADQVLHQH